MKNKKNIPKIKQENNSPKAGLVYFDFIALIYIVSLLIIDFIPTFNSLQIVSPQYLLFAIENVIIGIFILKNREILTPEFRNAFSNSIIPKLYLLFILLCLISAFFSNNLSLSIIALSQISIVFFIFINLTILFYNRLYLLYPIVMIVAISAFFQSILQINDFINVSKSDSISNGLYMLKGNTGSINIFAASLNYKIAFLIIGVFYYKSWKQLFLAITLFSTTLCVLLTSSRASAVALFLMFVVSILYYLLTSKTKKSTLITALFVIIPLCLSFLTTNIIFEKSKDKDRFTSVTSRIGTITEKIEDSRLSFWNNALKMTHKNPLFGVGIGNWKIESIPYEINFLDDSALSIHSHNDFLEITAETGILNGIVYLSIFIFVFFITVKRIIQHKENEINILILILLITYGIDAFFNFPMYRPTMQISFCFILMFTLLNGVEDDEKQNNIFSFKYIPHIIILTGIINIYFSYCNFKANQLEYARRLDSMIKTPLLSGKYILENLPQFPNVSANSDPFLEQAAIYFYNEQNYEESKKYFNKAKKINPYLGNSDWYLHKIYKAENKMDSAYFYVKKAFYLRPRNKSFYLDGLFMANIKKDTIEILKIHEIYNGFRKDPSNWINTSNALIWKSNYNTKKLILFIDKGLLEFPDDSLLVERREFFQKKLINNTTITKNEKNITTKSIKIDFNAINKSLREAEKLGAESKFNEALQIYKNVSKLIPTNSEVLQAIGLCYFKLNQFKTAIIYLEKTLNSPLLKDGKTEYVLGISYLNTNNKEKGCLFINISKNKNYPEATRIQDQYCK